MKTVTIYFDGYDYRVPGPDGREATSYYTDDKDDAKGTAELMYGEPVRIRIRRIDD